MMRELVKWKIRKEIKIVGRLSFSWVFMWSWTYIVCAFVKPDIFYGLGVPFSPVNLVFGLLLLLSLVYDIKALLFVGGIIEVVGGVASWAGLTKWNVLWTVGYDPLAQISMAVLDLVAAVFLFHRSFNRFEQQFPYY